MARIDELMAEIEAMGVFEELRRVDETLGRDRAELARWRRRYDMLRVASCLMALWGALGWLLWALKVWG